MSDFLDRLIRLKAEGKINPGAGDFGRAADDDCDMGLICGGKKIPGTGLCRACTDRLTRSLSKAVDDMIDDVLEEPDPADWWKRGAD